MKRTWKTKTAGILAIVAGAISVAQWGLVAVLGLREWEWLTTGGLLGAGAIVEGLAAIAIALGIVAIVGGVFASRRKRWRLALAGSICAVFSLWFIPILMNVPLAIAAIVLIVLGKREFE
jgi:hypothetical protein